MKINFLIAALLATLCVSGQELYVFSEPASNMPAKSISVKQTAKWLGSTMSGRTESRHSSELMFGVNRNLMVHAAVTLSDMYSRSQRFESVRTYAKYRFLTLDGMYSHFRMAAFAEASHSRNVSMYDELSLEGDQSGVQAGIIATQLLHKLAISTTLSLTESLQKGRSLPSPKAVPYQAFNYSLSAGYLVLPRKYTSYDQTNLNLYVELLGQRTYDKKRYFVDIAPAVQLIFNSQAKLNMGYRFQLGGNMHRMAEKSWMLSFEWLFLNALK
ncbi:MAG TPA: hypothetical protein DHW64_00370 [Chitinophagaceae bacterium]|nr:hypothetical protein [Chitinophagaceae bacterium]